MELLQLGSGAPECSNSVLLGEGFPSESVTVQICSALLHLCSGKRSHSRELLEEKNPGEWLPLPGWKTSCKLNRDRAYRGLHRGGVFQGGEGLVSFPCSGIG